MDKVDKLLLELKRVLSVIDDSYISKISNCLMNDSEYDKLFYHYANVMGLDLNTAKKNCIDKIKMEISNGSFDEKIRDYYIINELKSSKFLDLYGLIEDGLSLISADEIEYNLLNNRGIINGIDYIYNINLEEELKYIKLYLSSIFYQYMLSYLDLVEEDDYYTTVNTKFVDIFNSLESISSISEVVNIFDSNIGEIIDIFYIYTNNIDKKGRDFIHLKTIKIIK